jgi:hypothetical protein
MLERDDGSFHRIAQIRNTMQFLNRKGLESLKGKVLTTSEVFMDIPVQVVVDCTRVLQMAIRGLRLF